MMRKNIQRVSMHACTRLSLVFLSLVCSAPTSRRSDEDNDNSSSDDELDMVEIDPEEINICDELELNPLGPEEGTHIWNLVVDRLW